MATILCIRINWNHTAIPLRIADKFFTLEVNPEIEYPLGRKGLCLVRMWQQLAQPDFTGMLLLDGDVAIDPYDYDVMLEAIGKEPELIHTAPVRLWPVSTHVDGWVWGHGIEGRYRQIDRTYQLDMFTFCFTYLPRQLIEFCISGGMADWCFPHVDRNVCREAKELGTKVNLVRKATPKHLNY